MSLALTSGTVRSLSPRTRLKKRHLDALQAAISDAEAWRGSLMGHYPDDEESILAEQERLAKFDARIKVMREALALVRKMNKEK
jgi:hypothetical protein